MQSNARLIMVHEVRKELHSSVCVEMRLDEAGLA